MVESEVVPAPIVERNRSIGRLFSEISSYARRFRDFLESSPQKALAIACAVGGYGFLIWQASESLGDPIKGVAVVVVGTVATFAIALPVGYLIMDH